MLTLNVMQSRESIMVKPNIRQREVALYLGQVHGLKAFANAPICAHNNPDALLREFRETSERGLDQIRSVPAEYGAISGYRRLCDELIVAIARKAGETQARRRIIL